ncbi:MAG: glycosyltransferase [Pirellulaceae bacterium]
MPSAGFAPAETRQGRTLVTRLSIVIPCLGPCEQFEETLASVLQHRPDRSEIIVAHARPYSDPYQLRGEVAFSHIETRSLVDLVNDSIQDARGDVVHLLAAGTEVRDGWTHSALRHFADPRVAAVAPLVLKLASPGRIETMGVSYQRGGERVSVGHDLPIPDHHALQDEVLGPTLLAGFFSRDALLALGGFCREVGDELADIDLALALRDLGCRSVLEPKSQVSYATLHNKRSTFGAVSRGWGAENLFWRHWGREGRTVSLIAHPMTSLLDAIRHEGIVAGGLKLLGRTLGLSSVRASNGYERQLSAATELLGDLETRGETLSLTAAREERAKAPPARPTRQRAA